MNVYDYYGPQPFNLTGFPLWWLFTNVGGGIVTGAVLYQGRRFFTGWRALAPVLLVPFAFGAWEVFTGWPMFAALNTGAGFPLTYPASLLTVAISLSTAFVIARAVGAGASPAVPVPPGQPDLEESSYVSNRTGPHRGGPGGSPRPPGGADVERELRVPGV